MSIQILQYEFLGPIRLDEWGPPMEKVVYLILSRVKDSFNIIYVGDCEKTEEKNFFVSNPDFKCWIKTTGSENSLYLAILPMFDSNQIARKGVVNKILVRYKPPCNKTENIKNPIDYKIRPRFHTQKAETAEDGSNMNEKVSCPCCGSEMKVDQILENTTVLKCSGCGLSDTRLNS